MMKKHTLIFMAGGLGGNYVGLTLYKRLSGRPLIALTLGMMLLLAFNAGLQNAYIARLHAPADMGRDGLWLFVGIAGLHSVAGALKGARRQWRASRAKAARRKQTLA